MVDLEQLRIVLANVLEDEVAPHFKNPKITLVVRAPQLPDGDVVITDDNLDLVVAAINRLKERGSGRANG